MKCMTARARTLVVLVGSLAVAATISLAVAAGAGAREEAAATLPPGNTVQQWNQIAEDTVVGSGAFQSEGMLYMGYESAAVYDAVVSLEGGYQPLEPSFKVSKQASPDAAVVEAAYTILRHYFPASYTTLDPLYAEALAAIPDGPAKVSGQRIGLVAANQVIRARSVDGLTMPIAVSSTFPTLPPGPGVWRLTPPYQAPQTPWVGNVHPFILQKPSQFLPPPPPALSSPEWVAAFNEVEAYGGVNSTVRTPDETNIAEFWSANVIRQFNGIVREIADTQGLSLVKTARLAAMIDVIGSDAGIAFMNAKYHYLFWRPVTAIDPTSVSPDGYGAVPGPDDGNPATVEQPGWRPLLATPNHPEYPSAHGTFAGAVGEILDAFLGTKQINIDVHGFDPNGPAGNLNAVHHFTTAADMITEAGNARVWAGLHYRFSVLAGNVLGIKVADYDLQQAFQPTT
jgi:PAP2 superfamily